MHVSKIQIDLLKKSIDFLKLSKKKKNKYLSKSFMLFDNLGEKSRKFNN